MATVTNTDYTKPPRGLRWRSNTIFILSTVAVGLFTDLFLYGLIVPILPFVLSDRISIPHSEIQSYTSLLLACYAGASVVFSLPAGYIADKLPARQLPFLIGLVALTLATVLLFVGKSITVLVVARILQGTSAAVVWTIGMALVMDTVGSANLGVTIGSIFSIISVGELLAPVVGGVIYAKAGPNAVLGLGLGLLAIDFIMRLLVVEKKVAARYGLVDPSSDNSSETAQDDEDADEESPLMGTKDDEEHWKIPKDQPKWIKALPIVYCLSDARLLCAQVVAFTQAALLGVFDATIPTEAQDLFGFDSLKAGVMFMPLVLPYLLLGPLAGKFVDRYGTKPACVVGFASQTIPLILLRIPHAGGGAEIAKFSVCVGLAGVGLALISSPSIVEASYVIEKYHKANKGFFGEEGPYAQLYAINSVCFCFGLTVGPLVAGALRDSIGYGNMNAVIAAWSFLISILSFFYMGGQPRILKKSR
ncbi:putative MFS-type transporter [Hyphodiscus hymeniophilus]|uniref:MFS-type transporter n=1 Tax=Hyphodiscus hymeniophilus TaxID=353542 RepID=A0A9P7AVT9_9HELO|nr:putative MFS-type transporter [Hyphodiscus hymeniophilus]